MRAFPLFAFSVVGFLTPLYIPSLNFLAWGGFFSLFFWAMDPQTNRRSFGFRAGILWILYYSIPLIGLLKFNPLLFLTILLLFVSTWLIYFLLVREIAIRTKSLLLALGSSIGLWILLIFFFSLSPFGTASLETPFYGPLAFLQTVRYGGILPLGSLILALNISLAWAAVGQKKTTGRSAFLGFLMILLAVYFWGSKELQKSATTPEAFGKIALVQHNLPISGLWRLKHGKELEETYRKLGEAATKDRAKLIIYPFFDLPDDPLRKPEFLSALARELSVYLLMGSHISKTPGGEALDEGFLSVALLFSPEGQILGKHQSTQAAPSFGSMKEWTADRYEILEAPFGKVGVLLCFEDTNPRIAREAKKQGAQLLVALSNPGFFVRTALPYYHLMQDQLRAIETGLPLVRVSANGYSAFIDSKGRILKQSTLAREEILFG